MPAGLLGSERASFGPLGKVRMSALTPLQTADAGPFGRRRRGRLASTSHQVEEGMARGG